MRLVLRELRQLISEAAEEYDPSNEIYVELVQMFQSWFGEDKVEDMSAGVVRRFVVNVKERKQTQGMIVDRVKDVMKTVSGDSIVDGDTYHSGQYQLETRGLDSPVQVTLWFEYGELWVVVFN